MKQGKIPEDPMPVTTARARLFDLVEEVLTGRKPRVELSHRGHQEHLILIRKGELEGLEADLAALRSRSGPPARPLRGLGEIHVDPDRGLVRSRERHARLAAVKRAALRR